MIKFQHLKFQHQLQVLLRIGCRWGIGLGLVLGLTLGIGLGAIGLRPAQAETLTTSPLPLTVELLQERLKTPQQVDGMRVIDLHHLVIDLRPESGSFRQEFYDRIRAQLQKPGIPTGLDLSESRIQGDLDLTQLGLRAPLYGQAFSPIFSETEQIQLQRDRRNLSQLGQLSQSLLTTSNPSSGPAARAQITVFRGPLLLNHTRLEGEVLAGNTFFLNRLEAQQAEFWQDADWFETRFSLPSNFAGASFRQVARFQKSIFFAKTNFSQVQFRGMANFQGCDFLSQARFSQSRFQQSASFSRSQFRAQADFSQAQWQSTVSFVKAQFHQAAFFTAALFKDAVTFREARFDEPVNLRTAQVLSRIDFSYSKFAVHAYVNIAGLELDPERARLISDPGRMGPVLRASTLTGNEVVFRNLVRNFRQLQQVQDANAVEGVTQHLRLQELGHRWQRLNLNTAAAAELAVVGFSAVQIEQILQTRLETPFYTLADLLSLDTIDLATYVRVRNRVVIDLPLQGVQAMLHRLNLGWQWLSLNLLLLLSGYGSCLWLVLGVGWVAIAEFGIFFWLLDRVRRWRPQRILPERTEVVWVLGSGLLLFSLGVAAIVHDAEAPLWTLAGLEFFVLPVPLLLLGITYGQGRYHGLMETSYFVEEGTLRQLRLLIGRLPVIPRYPLFRERYLALMWQKRWNWLNYYDFSLNNFLRLGFNDIRVRDEQIPGWITALIWYQWGLGIIYLCLLLWTLSRTIPGLNLLIYLK